MRTCEMRLLLRLLTRLVHATNHGSRSEPDEIIQTLILLHRENPYTSEEFEEYLAGPGENALILFLAGRDGDDTK